MADPESIDRNDRRTEWHYNELIARDGQTFVFLDSVFLDEGNAPIFGAKGSCMVPVTQDEMGRRREEMRDPEWSSMHHIYMKQVEDGLDQSWSDWIDEQLSREGDRLLYDPSYEAKYGEAVRERCEKEDDLPDPSDVAVVECIGGGRMFYDVEREFDAVYDQELLAIAAGAEDGIMPDDLE